MGASLCGLRPPDPSKVDGTVRQESIVENQSNPAGTSPTVAASLMLPIKSASCFKSSTSINSTASSTTATGSVNVDETSKKKTQSSIDQYMKEIVDKVMTKNGDHDQAAGTRTLGEWILASPAPKRRVDYALRKRVLMNPWVPRANSSMGVITNCSTKKRSLILRRGAHDLNEDRENSTHDLCQQHVAGDRPLLLTSPNGTAYNKYNNNYELRMSSSMNNFNVHHDVDGDDDDANFRGARDSICIAKARRRVSMQGSLASRSINHGSAAVVKMKKKVSFRLPEEADIFFFYSPANNIDNQCSVSVNEDHN